MKKQLLIGLVSIGSLWVLYSAYLNFNGYCSAEGKHLSSQQLYKIVVRNALYSLSDDNQSTFPKNLSSQELEERIDSSVAKFFLENPNCCKVITNKTDYMNSEDYRRSVGSEGYFLPTFLGRINGAQAFTIEIRYVGKRLNSVSYNFSAPRVLYRTLSTCGKVYNYL